MRPQRETFNSLGVHNIVGDVVLGISLQYSSATLNTAYEFPLLGAFRQCVLGLGLRIDYGKGMNLKQLDGDPRASW